MSGSYFAYFFSQNPPPPLSLTPLAVSSFMIPSYSLLRERFKTCVDGHVSRFSVPVCKLCVGMNVMRCKKKTAATTTQNKFPNGNFTYYKHDCLDGCMNEWVNETMNIACSTVNVHRLGAVFPGTNLLVVCSWHVSISLSTNILRNERKA